MNIVKNIKMLVVILIPLMSATSSFGLVHQLDSNITGEIDDIGWYTSLVLDNHGYPHISYYDYTNGDLKYAFFKEDAWEIHTIDTEGNVGRCSSLALDESDNPHISYYDYTNGDLKYASYIDNNWNIVTIDRWGNVGLYTSIALDSKNHPHISYINYDTRVLKYAFFDGTHWIKTIVDRTTSIGADCYFGDYTSISLDKYDTPHISYCDIKNFDLKYAYLRENTWYKEVVDSSGDVGVYSSLALDIDSNPHISYTDLTNAGFNLKYAQKDDDGWRIEFVDTEGDVRKWTSLILDSTGMPHISYYDYTKGSMQYALYTNDSWHKETVEVNGSTGCFNSIFLDEGDRPCISYYDWGHKALKYSIKTENNWIIDVIERDTNTDMIDQQQIYCSGYAAGILDNEPLAQSFIPMYPVLSRVELMLVKRYNPGSFTLSIREHLNGEDLAYMHLSSMDIPEDIAWKPFDFPDMYVQPGQTYYIVCTSEDTGDNNMYYWYFGHNNPYTIGNAWIYDSNTWKQFKISAFPDIDMGFKTFGLNTSIPQIPVLDGPTSGKIGEEYTYTIFSDDVDDEYLWYDIKWGSNEKSTIGPFPSGEAISVNHSWFGKGDYAIMVKAVDSHGAESDWATFNVSIQKRVGIHDISLFKIFLTKLFSNILNI